MREVRWERMFPDQLEQAFLECPLVYFTYGLCEPHGPHNALGLDELKAHAIACATARSHGGIVAPPDYWHIHEVGGYGNWAHHQIGNPPRNWLTSIPPWQHFKNVCYHIRMADTLGFHAAILLTGHYGPNWQDLKRLVAIIQPHVGTRLYALPEFESNYKGYTGDGSNTGDHAGRVETSLLWALEPECVDISRIPERTQDGTYFALGGDAYQANRQVGERMVADEVEWLGNKGRELLEAYDQIQPKHTLLTFREVENLWHQLILPEMVEFESIKEIWEWQEPIPEDSPWYDNMKIPDNWR
jgi:creatinine amidohydrolase/Fe(II)-dependent formamide hydrolase-like protein